MDEPGRLHRRALRHAYLSMGWMVIEAGVAVTAGIGVPLMGAVP